jgi:hypothetical protein
MRTSEKTGCTETSEVEVQAFSEEMPLFLLEWKIAYASRVMSDDQWGGEGMAKVRSAFGASTMTLEEYSRVLLSEALREGQITLDDGSVRVLSTTQIIGVAKYILSNQIVPVDESLHYQENVPAEMFDTYPGESPGC